MGTPRKIESATEDKEITMLLIANERKFHLPKISTYAAMVGIAGKRDGVNDSVKVSNDVTTRKYTGKTVRMTAKITIR
jgi:hypothetical protein